MTTLRRCSASTLPSRPRRNPVLLAAACAAALGAALAAQPLAAQPSGGGGARDSAVRDSALCATYTEGARGALARCSVAEARELLDLALSFSDADSDANYLRAALGLALGETPAPAMRRLETALASDSFRQVRRGEAELLYAGLLARTRRYHEALRFLEGQPPSAEALYVEAAARRGSGDEAGSRAAVVESLERYPGDPRPLIAWLRAADRPYASQGDRALVERVFASLDSLKEMDRSVLVDIAPYAASLEEARYLVREYRAMGGASAASTLAALRYGLIAEDRAVEELLSGAYPVSMRDVSTLASLASGPEARNRLFAAFGGFSGVIYGDDDRDGFPESSTAYERGLPAAWTLDADQDGESELAVSFAAGAPVSMEAASGSTSVSASYGPWPYLSSIEFRDGEGSRRYLFAASSVALPVVSLERVADAPGAPRVVSRSGAALPSETAMASSAYVVGRRVTAASPSGGSETIAELRAGLVSRAWWRDAYGRAGSATYRSGVPDDERIDLDGDGRAEARRAWELSPDGRPRASYIEADLDGDGLFEYREAMEPPYRAFWDYDGDGAFDLAMERLDDGSRVYEFASKPGAAMDTKAAYRDGRLTGVVRGGVSLPLIADSGGSVLWISQKPFDFGTEVPAPGMGARSGLRYWVLELGGALYAEVLR